MNLLTLLLPLIAVLQPGQTIKLPKFEAKLYAAHTAVQPGGQTELAVELTFETGWHIYHPITIGAGAPTTIDFELPKGAAVGDLRFPTPTLGDEKGIEYLGLEDRAVVLTTLKLAADAGAEPLQIGAKVRALACKQVCVKVEAEAALTLNVSAQAPAPAHEKLFEEAREALPKPLAQAKYIEGSRLLVSHRKVPVGGKGMLAAVIRVKPEHHIQDRNPGVEGFIASRFFIEPHDGIEFDPDGQIWPDPHVEKVPEIGSVRTQSGEVAIGLPFAITDQKFKPGLVRLRVLFQYQCCKDRGVCYPPEMAEAYAEFEVVPASAAAVKNDDPIFAKLAAQKPTTQAAGQKGESTDASGSGGAKPPENVLIVFLSAFLGGMILNITPCVLPVISLKIFGFVQQAREESGRVFRMGLVYAGGIMACFAVLAGLMVFAGLAWGGLMQSSGFLIGMCGVVFAFALSLLGVFEIQLPGFAMSAAGEAAGKEGYGGAFVNGILAVLLATPCVAPFLGFAIGLLTQMPPAVAGAGIMVAGVGLAAPYVLLSAFPGWLRFLPKPGPWMVTFKQIVGFILVAVVIWLISVLIVMVDHAQLLGTLGMLCAVGVGCWILGRITLSDSAVRTGTLWVLALLFVFGGGWTSFWLFAEGAKLPWQRWEPGIGERLAAEGYTVYVDYTATWCLTCQTNKKWVLETKRVAGEFENLGLYPIEADFTNPNKEMQKELRSHRRAGVPLNIILPAGKPNEPIVLPEVLTRSIVLKALEKAGPSKVRPSFWPQKP